MKRALSLALVFALCLSLCACGKSKEVKNVEELISAIGEVSLESGDAVVAAQEAYALLEDAEKEKVSNIDELNAAFSQYKTLAKDKIEDMKMESLKILLADYDYALAYQTWEEILSLSTVIGDTEMIEEAENMLAGLPYCLYEGTDVIKLEWIVQGTEEYFEKGYMDGGKMWYTYNFPTAKMLEDAFNLYLEYMDACFEIAEEGQGYVDYLTEDGYHISVDAAVFVTSNKLYVRFDEEMLN